LSLKQKKLCFVIGPIGAHRSPERRHADKLLSKVIRPTFTKHFKEFRVERADHIARPGLIDSQIITNLIEAELVVADLMGRNANAFYELGIRHMLQKPVIHLFRRGDVIPADVAPYRAVEYSYQSAAQIRDTIAVFKRTIAETILPTYVVENPVTRSAGFVRMKQPEPPEKGPAIPRPKANNTDALMEDLPGVVWRKRANGTTSAYWVSKTLAHKMGFKPSTVTLWNGIKDEFSEIDKMMLTNKAGILQQEMEEWLAYRGH